MITYKMGHRRSSRSILSCSNDASRCRPSACDEEELWHVICCSRCASSIDWRTLGYELEPLIPTNDVAPVNLAPVSRTLTLARVDVQLEFSIAGWWNALYQPILAEYALR